MPGSVEISWMHRWAYNQQYHSKDGWNDHSLFKRITSHNEYQRQVLPIYRFRFRTQRCELLGFVIIEAKSRHYLVTRWFHFRPNAKQQMGCCNFPIITCNLKIEIQHPFNSFLCHAPKPTHTLWRRILSNRQCTLTRTAMRNLYKDRKSVV